MPTNERDASVVISGTVKRKVTRDTADGQKQYLVFEANDNFGDREAYFVKVTPEHDFTSFEEGAFYHIPVRYFIGDQKRIFWRTAPDASPQRIAA